MKSFCLLLLLCSFGELYAQKIPKPDKYAKTITATDLSKHLYIIASKEMEGRETGMPGERKAAAYIENEFRRIGLLPGNNGQYQMPYTVYQDSLLNAIVEVNGEKFELDKDFNVNVSNNAKASLAFNEIVFIGKESGDSIRKMNLTGKLIIVPGNALSSNIFNILVTQGPAGILYISEKKQRERYQPKKGNIIKDKFKRYIPFQQYFVSPDIARKILSDQYDSLVSNNKAVKIITSKIFLETEKISIPLSTSNVVGIIEGTDLKDQYLFITSHHDHIGKRDTVINYGADDDGSGTVSIIELAEAFAKAKKDGKGPRRTVVFMTVSGEEKGLWGSDYYSSNPIFPLEKTTADLNIDMIGRMDPKRTTGDSMNYVYVVGDDKLSSDLRPISESANKKYTKLELDYKFNDPKDPMRIYYRSDHYNFAKKGVPIIFYFNGTHADYHRPTDTPDKINYTLMAKRAQFVFYTAWEMANRNEMLKRDIPLDTEVFNR